MGHVDPHCPPLHSEMLCPLHAKGLGLGSTCSPRQGRIERIFLSLSHSLWSPNF